MKIDDDMRVRMLLKDSIQYVRNLNLTFTEYCTVSHMTEEVVANRTRTVIWGATQNAIGEYLMCAVYEK
jgi:hypothetical protein